MTIELIETLEEFNTLQDKWDNLVKRSTRPSPFFLWRWHYNWIKHFGSKNKLLIICVYSNNELIGLAPFVYVTQRPIRFLRLRYLNLTSSTSLGSDYLDIIAASGHESKVIDEVFAFLKNRRNWDIIELNGVAEDSPFRKSIKTILEAGNRAAAIVPALL